MVSTWFLSDDPASILDRDIAGFEQHQHRFHGLARSGRSPPRVHALAGHLHGDGQDTPGAEVRSLGKIWKKGWNLVPKYCV